MMAEFYPGSIGRVFVVLHLNGKLQGLVVEPTMIRIDHDSIPVDLEDYPNPRFPPTIEITGLVLEFRESTDTPEDLSPRKQITTPMKQIPERCSLDHEDCEGDDD